MRDIGKPWSPTGRWRSHVWRCLGSPDICHLFYTTAIWDKEILHLKGCKFTTKVVLRQNWGENFTLCVKFYTVCKAVSSSTIWKNLHLVKFVYNDYNDYNDYIDYNDIIFIIISVSLQGISSLKLTQASCKAHFFRLYARHNGSLAAMSSVWPALLVTRWWL